MATFQGQTIACSLALAFLLTSVSFLSPEGEALALLPTGCLTSQKDSEAWKVIKSVYQCQTLGINDHKTFDLCFPRTVLVKLARAGTVTQVEERRESLPRCGKEIEVRIVRGTVQMHVIDGAEGEMPLIHTTDLLRHEVRPGRHVQYSNGRRITGPAVLLPRVGLPSKDKVCLYIASESVLLSDCVFALTCKSPEEAGIIWKVICEGWEVILQEYGGTCAPFITVASLKRGLEQLGISASV